MWLLFCGRGHVVAETGAFGQWRRRCARLLDWLGWQGGLLLLGFGLVHVLDWVGFVYYFI